MNAGNPELVLTQDELFNLAACLSGQHQRVDYNYFHWWVGEEAKRKTVSTEVPLWTP